MGRTAASLIPSEIGLDMTRFPTAGHPASWARFALTMKESAGRKKGRSATGHGNPHLARVLGEAAVSAGRTNTFLGRRYRRIARRRGKTRAIVESGLKHSRPLSAPRGAHGKRDQRAHPSSGTCRNRLTERDTVPKQPQSAMRGTSITPLDHRKREDQNLADEPSGRGSRRWRRGRGPGRRSSRPRRGT
ncbi:transposase [Nonomuraea sp. CA-141351]|uniref:transposase n=1 Tax=Nonomuraea sp. CA-141351 TaxID=3239996 RepID=UPI003D90CEDA